MSYDLSKLVKLSALQDLAQRITNLFATKEEVQSQEIFSITFRKGQNEEQNTVDKEAQDIIDALEANKTIQCYLMDDNDCKWSLPIMTTQIREAVVTGKYYTINAMTYYTKNPDAPYDQYTYYDCMWAFRGGLVNIIINDSAA